MLELDGVPTVVSERLEELDPDNLILQYFDNVRRARWEGKIRPRPSPGEG
jgi:aryl carrier-like protein